MTVEAPTPDATLTLSAELINGMWTVFFVNGDQRTMLGAGTTGSGIMFPTSLLDLAATQAS